MRRLLLLLPLALVLGPASGTASSPKTAKVTVKNIDFSPHKLTVKAGTRVTWSFRDQYTLHNIRPKGKPRFQGSGNKPYGSTYSVRFTKRGTYKYVCTIHPNMKATIVVK